MKYLFSLAVIIIMTIACNDSNQNAAPGNSADIRDSSNRTNPNMNMDDSTHQHDPADTSHHHKG